MQIVIPMAGRGARFEEKGYTFPKPLIEIAGRSMIELVLENLTPPANSPFTFICRKEHLTRFYLGDVIRMLSPGCEIIPVETDTAGALCSVLLAIDQIDPEGELLIANGDQYIDSSLRPFYERCREPGTDGCVLTFRATHPRWSFVRTDTKGKVTAVAEKRPISNQATVGLYYFRKGKDLLEGAERMILKGLRTSGQFFVCPVYNEMILAGRRITTERLPDGAMHSMGTPEDVEEFRRLVDLRTMKSVNGEEGENEDFL